MKKIYFNSCDLNLVRKSIKMDLFGQKYHKKRGIFPWLTQWYVSWASSLGFGLIIYLVIEQINGLLKIESNQRKI